MDLQHWQAQFENWLKNHHQHQDAAHDVCHFRRVWATAQKLAADDDVDMLVILTACYFHDIVSLAKNHPQRQRSSILAAEETRRLLCEEFEQFPAEKIEAVCHAIAAHSFSAQIAPLTTEAKIVQDADRLEALGAIGLALFDAEDPLAQHRPLDDKRYALDHFQTKLLKLPQTMQTVRGKQLAQHNAQFLVEFMAKLSAELAGENEGVDHKVIDAFSPAG
ncbi:TPA: phosphohydrolase [Escherichia coli]|uniref:phosphohydrolase n=1 Tax=Escherichia coli TaxID=562 RepID=UPI00199B770E|nr:phosphohydrolase [Escherichia coli]MBS9701328.1 phosphohydrolase [Escherichia coli]MDY8285439.1 phosphohydrolase [Escherichia coli]MDY8312581.1 phosphohydrolase [Escherichia coli]MDY8509078.1 phosphohydrolase [Escherichia coli]MEB7109328.1 phosphohydrolase [Escherichia coli]